ncbi:MAG TPA: AbrB/MazE/SpoVT family DNA-binding domain-containing protein [Fibrobacteraceae bacterium]|nr:AbrB/MazE/SpoVT family DNA-binding domain-containing protein [Fibrobacteraceae bacterium]
MTTESEYSSLTSKGQITIPIEVREALGLKQGERVSFVAESGTAYRIQAVHWHKKSGQLTLTFDRKAAKRAGDYMKELV